MDYIPINVSTLKAGFIFPFCLYVRINEKHLLYIRKGDDIDEVRLINLYDQEMNRIFVSNTEFDLYNNYVSEEIDKAVESEEMPLDEKIEIVESASINAIEAVNALQDDPNSEEAFKLTMKAAKGVRKVINKNPDALKKIYFQRGRNHDLILSHCKNVSALAVRFAFLEGFKGEDLDNLATAALLHDIGLNKLKRDDQMMLFKKESEKYTPDDKRMYYAHVVDGVKMLKNRKYVNASIIKLIECHEEKLQGKGYPNNQQKLEPLEELLSLVNCFDKKVTVHQMKPEDAYQDLFAKEIGQYDLELMKRLKNALIGEGLIE